MTDIVIKVENLSKQYRLGNVGTGTLGHDLNRWWQTTVLRKEDPYLKIGETNDRSIKGNSEYVWALRDINFEVKQGEVLGIIGRNGAGKSTLLKILSRTTSPTTGAVKIKGRVASLLEVGTGFHPELTGRENIFLNGAILGMTKAEIKSKFDEIVDFAGVERYIDTPVKRYSSGMYVRLAFGVAAHLEPEILIVDEVLAVGDIEFQKKALGKMKDVSAGQGRTVLFVSHNMAAMKTLTNRCIFLKNGQVEIDGITDSVIDYYASSVVESINKYNFETHLTNSKPLQFIDVCILNEDEQVSENLTSGKKVKFRFKIINKTENDYHNCSVGIGIFTNTDLLLIALKNDTQGKYYTITPGINEIYCEIERFPLSNGIYKYNVILNNYSETFDWIKDVGIFEVENGFFFENGKTPAMSSPTVLIDHKWK